MRLIIIFYFLICIAGCTNENKIYFDDFPFIKLVSKTEISVNDVLRMPCEMELLDDIMVIMNLKGDKFFQIFNFPELCYLDGYLSRGRGPGEEITIDPYIRHLSGNKFLFRTLTAIKIAEFDLNEKNFFIKKVIHIPGVLMNLNHPFILDSILYGYNLTEITAKEFVGYNPKTNKIIDFGPSFPKVNRRVPKNLRNNIFAKVIVVKPDMSRFASVYDLFPLLRIYSKDGHLIKETYYENNQIFPYAVMSSNPNKLDADRVMQNYRKIKATNCYIYGLYCGKTIGENNVRFNEEGLNDTSNEIHVWDWNGNPVMKILLDEQIFSFCVSPDDSYIICTSLNSKNNFYKYGLF